MATLNGIQKGIALDLEVEPLKPFCQTFRLSKEPLSEDIAHTAFTPPRPAVLSSDNFRRDRQNLL